jgi:hypothetical protein
MAPRLKVFVTSDGLTDYVVATSSKAKALAAWGIRQDVFKEGAAHETDEPALVKAAQAQPGEVLRRPAGTRETLAKLKPAKAAKPAGPTKAQLKKVATLEKQLADLDAGHERAAEALERRRADLDREEEALHARHEAQRAKLEASLHDARRAIG